MIHNFKLIGEHLLEKDGFYDTEDEIEKRKILLNHQALKPYIKKDKNKNVILDGKAICLNFDLDKDIFEFKLSDNDLENNNKKRIFAFRLGAPRGKKKFLSTNSIDTFYSALFSQSLQYINSKRKNNKSRTWFSQNVKVAYDDLLNTIFHQFYVQSGKEFFLNYQKLKHTQKVVFLQIQDGIKRKVKPDELYNRLINKIFFNSEAKETSDFPSINFVLINNHHILEYEEKKYRKDYINLCFYDLMERFFVEDSKKNKRCHICNQTAKITQNIPFSMKFYGTTNNLNFENAKNGNAYKSFSICENCLQPALTGMKHIEQYFSNYLFDMNYYLIPHADNSVPLQIFGRINNIFKSQKQRYTDDITFVKNALKAANRKTARFDLFFYYSPENSQQFYVLQYIPNIDIQSLFTKLEMFDATSETYLLDRIVETDKSLTIQDLRFFLFPSSFSQSSQPDTKEFRKDLLSFLRCFLNDLTFNYNDLISKFVGIYKKRMHCEKQDNLSPFKMNLFLSILCQLKKLRGGDSLSTGESISNIFKDEYKSFFEVHSDIYRDNAYRQGLFLLGTLISKIKSKQKGKSSTFLKKLNFSGIPPRRVPTLISQVKEFSQIYKIYEEPGVWGNVMDRLQGIQTSGMKPDEILFYILSGISFDDYLGMKAWHEKQLTENTQGEKNDH